MLGLSPTRSRGHEEWVGTYDYASCEMVMINFEVLQSSRNDGLRKRHLGSHPGYPLRLLELSLILICVMGLLRFPRRNVQWDTWESVQVA